MNFDWLVWADFDRLILMGRYDFLIFTVEVLNEGKRQSMFSWIWNVLEVAHKQRLIEGDHKIEKVLSAGKVF